MNPVPHRLLIAQLCAVSLLFSGPAQGFAQRPESRLQKIFANWQTRQEQIKVARYRISGQAVLPKGSLGDDVTGLPRVPPEPPTDIVQIQKFDVLFDTEKHRFRMYKDEEFYSGITKEVEKRISTTIFDMKDFFTVIPREQNMREESDPDVIIGKNYSKLYPLMVLNAYYLSPLLLGHGLVPRFLEAADFSQKLDADDFVFQGQGVHAGRPCWVLRTFPVKTLSDKTFDEFWVDKDRQSAVVRQSAYQNGTLVVDLDITYQQRGNTWLPARWTGTTRSPKQIINVTRLNIDELVLEPPSSNDDYAVDIRPGMSILETTFKEAGQGTSPTSSQRRYFRVAENGSWNEVGQDLQPGASFRSFSWLWLTLVPGIGLAAWVLLRWRSKAKSAHSK